MGLDPRAQLTALSALERTWVKVLVPASGVSLASVTTDPGNFFLASVGTAQIWCIYRQVSTCTLIYF